MPFLCGVRKVLRSDSVLEFRFRVFVVTAIRVLP
jgi:hypothetical protein